MNGTHKSMDVPIFPLDGKDSLAELFATIDYETVQKEMRNAAKNPEKVPPKIKRIIAKPVFPEIILNV